MQKKLTYFRKNKDKFTYIVLSIILLYSFFILTSILPDFSNSGSLIYSVKFLLVSNSLLFLLTALSINIWSVLNINSYLDNLSKKPNTVNQSNNNEQTSNNNIHIYKSDTTCDYCSEKDVGPILCSSCASILWKKIKSPKVQIAVFIAHHRWKILTGFIALFFLPTLSIIYTNGLESRDKLKIINNKVLQQIEDYNSIRSDIYTLMADINNSDSIDIFKFHKIAKKRLESSWDIYDLIKELKQRKNFNLNSNTIDCESDAFEYAVVIYNRIITSKDGIERFEALRDTLIRYKSKKINTESFEKISIAANNYYIELKVYNFILSIFANYPKREDKEIKGKIIDFFGKEGRNIDSISSGNYETERKYPFKQ